MPQGEQVLTGQTEWQQMSREERAQITGTQAAQNVQISNTSKSIHSKTSDISNTIRAGIPELIDKTGAAGQVLKYPVESTARLIEFGGMLPGGAEVLIKEPDTIKPALEVGLYQSTVGTAQAFKEDPKQTTSDFMTAGLLTYGAARGAGAAKAGVNKAANSKLVYDAKLTTNVKINDLKLQRQWARDPFKQPNKAVQTLDNIRFDVEVKKIQARETGHRVKQNLDNKLFDLEKKKLEFMSNEKGQTQLLQPLQKQQTRQIQYSRQVTRQKSDLIPSLDTQIKTRSIQKTKTVQAQTTGLKLNSLIGSMAGAALDQSQLTKQLQGLDLMQAQRRTTTPKLTQSLLSKQTVRQTPKQTQRTIFNNAIETVKPFNIPTVPKGTPKNKNIDIPDVTGWGKRKKSHYVADPSKIL